MNRKIIQISIHLAAWACFMMLPLVFFPRPKEQSGFALHAFNPYFVTINVLFISFYYLNTELFIPKLLERKKTVAYTLLILGLLIFFGMMPRLYQVVTLDWLKIPDPGRPTTRPRNVAPPLLSPGSIAIFLLVFIFSTGVKVISQWLESERRSKQIENEKLHTELSFLKAQINPHFLFNTLNNIYALAADRSDLTAPAVMKLSSIMRYVLSEAKGDLVPLDKEIQFISDYIELQKMRCSNKTLINFSVRGETAGKQVSPLIFLPFVENAFKYGISAREPSPIDIVLDVKENGELKLKVKNNKHLSSSAKYLQSNTGIGLQNTKRRLDLLYHNRYSLNIDDEPSSYTINLNMYLSC